MVMTDERLDPRRDRMMAAFCGDLSKDEEQAFLRSLEEDDEIRAEWEELLEVRSFLHQARAEESPGGFAFEMPPEEAKPVVWKRPRRSAWSLPSLFRSPVAGFALGAAAVVILLVAGLRIDHTGRGLLVHFGGAEPARTTAEGDFVTRAEVSSALADFGQAVDAQLIDYQTRSRGEMIYAMREMNNYLTRRQENENLLLNQRFQNVIDDLFQGGDRLVVEPKDGSSKQSVVPVSQQGTDPAEDLRHE